MVGASDVEILNGREVVLQVGKRKFLKIKGK
jgi:hypothetical protein